MMNKLANWKGLPSKTTFVTKKSNILAFNYNICCQIMNSAYIRYPHYKKIIKHSLRLVLSLIFSGWCHHYKNPAAASQHIWTQFSAIPLFNLGSMMKPFTMFYGDGCHVFREKHLNWNAENEVSMTCYNPLHCMMKLAPAQFHCNF